MIWNAAFYTVATILHTRSTFFRWGYGNHFQNCNLRTHITDWFIAFLVELLTGKCHKILIIKQHRFRKISGAVDSDLCRHMSPFMDKKLIIWKWYINTTHGCADFIWWNSENAMLHLHSQYGGAGRSNPSVGRYQHVYTAYEIQCPLVTWLHDKSGLWQVNYWPKYSEICRLIPHKAW